PEGIESTEFLGVIHVAAAPESFARIYGRGAAIAEIGVACALLIGGVLSERLGYTLVLVLSSMSPLVAALVAWLLLPDTEVHEAARRESYLHTLQAGWHHAIQTRVILYVIVLFAGVGTFYGVYEEYVGPFLREREFSLTMIGIVTALYQGCRAAGMWLAGRLPRVALPRLSLAYLGGAICLALVPLGPDVAMVALLCVFVILFAVAEIILETELQHAIDSHARATVTSVVSMAREIVGMLYFLLIGLMATATSWHEMTLSLGVACIGLTVIVILVGYRWRV
ncbi:MAG: MFS transporter, partial [Pseudomonadales bacterium]